MSSDKQFTTFDGDGNPVPIRAGFLHATFDDDGTMHSHGSTYRWVRVTRDEHDDTVIGQFILQFRDGALVSMGLRPAVEKTRPTEILAGQWSQFDYYVDDVTAPQNVESVIDGLDLPEAEKQALRDDERRHAAARRRELGESANRQAVDHLRRTRPAYIYPVIYGDVGAEDLDHRWQGPNGFKARSSVLAPVLGRFAEVGVQYVPLPTLRAAVQRHM